MGTGFARVTNLVPIPVPAQTPGLNLEPVLNWFSSFRNLLNPEPNQWFGSGQQLNLNFEIGVWTGPVWVWTKQGYYWVTQVESGSQSWICGDYGEVELWGNGESRTEEKLRSRYCGAGDWKETEARTYMRRVKKLPLPSKRLLQSVDIGKDSRIAKRGKSEVDFSVVVVADSCVVIPGVTFSGEDSSIPPWPVEMLTGGMQESLGILTSQPSPGWSVSSRTGSRLGEGEGTNGNVSGGGGTVTYPMGSVLVYIKLDEEDEELEEEA
ncbi:hypothetical protein EDB85DRAFT_1903289 [Lactarius pseudohatsudake]|nr:hypothetical protein EDB85DRAFT_1903289 [Lactarius pseudohatsudake]